ncbi:MAG: IS1634 family transposase [Candidatus Omnitrophota bacterium]
MIEELIRDKRYKEGNLTSEICLLTINRCIEPLTENKIKDWYEERSAISHLIPQETYSNRFYRGLKALDKIYSSLQIKITEQIKKKIYKGKKIEEIYYDLTSTYFESSKLCVLASFGYSRDKRPDKKQIVIGLVIDKYGFPLWVEIFPGNTSDKSTLKGRIDNLKEKVNIEDIILIGDRGLMSKGNILHIVEADYKYIIAMRNIECKKVIEFRPSEETMEKIEENKYIKEIIKGEEKYVIYLNTERRKKEQETRERNLSRLEERLKEIKEMIRKREIVSRDIILIKLGETFKKFSSVKKYIKIEIDEQLKGEGSFKYQINRKKVIEDKIFDGLTVIKTNVIPLQAKEIISTYKNLERIERAFRCLKDVIKIRPINHHRDENIRGHIYICILSYLLMTTIEYRLSVNSSSELYQQGTDGKDTDNFPEANWVLKDLSTIKLGDILVDKNPIKKGITPIEEKQKKILKALKIPKITF